MNAHKKLLLIFAVTIVISVSAAICSKRKNAKEQGMYNIYSTNDVVALFPKTTEDIEKLATTAITKAQVKIDELIAIPDEERTFANTAHVFDELCTLSHLAIAGNVIEALELVSPDEEIRKAAHDSVLKMQEFAVDAISNNKKLYQAFKAYAQENAPHELLNPEQKYFIEKTMQDFRRGGLDLPDEQLEHVKQIKKELAALELNFSTNVAQDTRTIELATSELQGLEADFISSLKRSSAGNALVGTDYPTYFAIMENCEIAATRKKVYELFANRAFPINEHILKDIMSKRDQLAKLLGYDSYADLDLSDQMVETVARAEQFIIDLSKKALEKEKQEFDELLRDVPASVQLVEGKMQPYDVMFAKNQYKKKYYNIDETAIAEYFPMEKTIKGLLDIYQQFFSLRFKELPISSAWHEDVKLIEVYDRKSNLLGYFLLDLYPRPNKYSHACQITIVPSTYIAAKPNIAISVVIANFPKSTATKPSLLKRKDVTTFFHEFGHALHALLGRTKVTAFAGTHVKRDFVEMPSQMLEEWMCDREILKMVSAHYKTGESLPDALIDSILKVKNFSSGAFVQTQLLYSRLSLDCFKAGADKNMQTLYAQLYESMRPYTAYSPADHMYASFGHLTGYGAKYYGYMWSKVFALDLFEEIKKHGLLDPEVGNKYVLVVLGKGGSKDPNILLKNFLGREPNQEAFLKDLGLEQA